MKKLFVISVIFSIISFICFGITVGMFGKRNYGPSSVQYVTSGYTNNGSGTVFKGDYDASASWTILNKFPDININSAGISTIITRGNSDRISVRLNNNTAHKKVHVEAVYEGDSLTIEARLTNITFLPDGTFGFVNWLEDIFTGTSSDVSVIIEFPATKYNSLNIQQGSGSIKVHDLYADHNKVHIGSGSFEMLRRSESFVASSFELELGSGNAVISGMQTDIYYIDIGSGSFNINDLSGTGAIDMGSGSGSIAYKEYNGDCALDIGSGTIKLFVPEDSSIGVNADIGSGRVDIEACDLKTDITSQNDDNVFHLGDGKYALNIDMGSGLVYLRDRSEYPPLIIATIPVSSDDFLQSSSEFNVNNGSYAFSSTSIGYVNGVEEIPQITITDIESSYFFEITEVPDAPEPPEDPVLLF